MKIDDVYFCEGIKGSILLTRRPVKDGWKFVHNGTDAKLLDVDGNSYNLDFTNNCWNVQMLHKSAMIKKITQKPSNELHLWCCCLGHTSETVVKSFLRKYQPNLKLHSKPFFCVQCAQFKAKDPKANGADTEIPRDKPMDLCMTNVAGPFPIDINGCRYVILFWDHASTYTFCTVMARKSKVPDKIMAWVLHLQNTDGRTPSYL